MATDAERVRRRLGERIPAGGTDADTMFSDAEIADLISEADGDIEAAVAEGWKVKAAEAVDLVNTQEGTAKRNLSDVHDHALEQVKATGPGGAASTPRTRLHRIVRS